MTDKQFCPRAIENGGGPNSPFRAPLNGEMEWRKGGFCSYCGSLNQDIFMARLEAGDVELIPTDKSYKVYVRNAGGAPFLRQYRNCPPGSNCTLETCTHRVEDSTDQTKFYFQHLTIPQRTRFIELYNAHSIKMGYPGHFYVVPFFTRPIDKGDGA